MVRRSEVISRFQRDDGGHVAITFAMCAVPIFAMMGLAVDYGQAVSARARLQNAADTAALAAVRMKDATESERIAQAQKLFSANLAGDSYLASVSPTITVQGDSVKVVANAAVGTAFANIVGVSELDISTESNAAHVTSSSRKLELSIMVDLTGSMGSYRGGMTKIEALKDAADDLLSILFPNGATTSSNVRVGVAPFADYVNAGPYASAVTGLPAGGVGFANVSNLGSTRQGTFRGFYSGMTGNAAGSQVGATSPTGISSPLGASAPASVNAAGSTFSNGYCATPTLTTTTTTTLSVDKGHIKKYKSEYTGVRVWIDGTNTVYPEPLMKATDNEPYYPIDKNKTRRGASYEYDDKREWGYYIPMYNPSSFAQLTIVQRTDGGVTGDVGVRVDFDDDATLPPELKEASSSAGYWRIRRYKNDAFEYEWTTTGRYMPVWSGGTTTTTTTSVVAGCEPEVVAQPTSKLISCVTERQGGNAYTDISPSSSAVGAFNHGNTSISNYSSDGKCWVAGRELPSVIPLTNDKQDLSDFFANATIGGATPGHIGTAWAWYLLSPNWASVWPSDSTPSAYNASNVSKVAVLMTDGEYNIHYASPSAREQALALCTSMKAAGITVYTVGFGFSTNSRAGDGTAEGNAKDILAKCSSGTNYFHFPYDGAALRQAFSDIANALASELNINVVKVTH
ncbi:MAG: pilus assembly protein TadG-related protein [Hyphomicrobiaceae bacterium]|nr:pilus assembly protein TadG-related protein [Hyphomicrobiaceae bacterium]